MNEACSIDACDVLPLRMREACTAEVCAARTVCVVLTLRVREACTAVCAAYTACNVLTLCEREKLALLMPVLHILHAMYLLYA